MQFWVKLFCGSGSVEALKAMKRKSVEGQLARDMINADALKAMKAKAAAAVKGADMKVNEGQDTQDEVVEDKAMKDNEGQGSHAEAVKGKAMKVNEGAKLPDEESSASKSSASESSASEEIKWPAWGAKLPDEV